MIIKKVVCDHCHHECHENDYITILMPYKEEYKCGSSTTIENGSRPAQVCKDCLAMFKTIDLRRMA